MDSNLLTNNYNVAKGFYTINFHEAAQPIAARYQSQDAFMASSDLSKGIALGIGAALILPIAATTLAPALRPFARSAIKAGILALEKGREASAELGEALEDLIAEVQEELRETRLAEEETAADEKPVVAAVVPAEKQQKKSAG
jgi:hypothetical protein